MIHLPLLINPLPFMYTTSRFRPLSLTDDRTGLQIRSVNKLLNESSFHRIWVMETPVLSVVTPQESIFEMDLISIH